MSAIMLPGRAPAPGSVSWCTNDKKKESAMSNTASAMTSSDGLPTLEQALAEVSAQPLWDRYQRVNTREPEHYEPIIWPWAKMAPLVDRAVREVSMKEAER